LGETRRLVAELVTAGLPYSEIATRLGICKSTVAYHARRIGTPADDRFAKRFDWPAIQEAYDTGLTARACAKRFGFSLSSWHQAVKRSRIVPRPRAMDINTFLVDGRPQTGRSHLKLRLFAAGLKENRCERCGLSDWLGKPLTMALHHRNGRGKDNRLENLQILCPNCHAQTENFGGRGVARLQDLVNGAA